MSPEARRPVISEMPIVTQAVFEDIRARRSSGGAGFFYRIGEGVVEHSPAHRQDYETALRKSEPAAIPDATSGAVLIVIHALELQAKLDGHSLPSIPNPIDPSPALREIFRRASSELDLINLAYDEMIRTSPVIDSLIQDLAVGAPDELLRIATIEQAKRGAVYAYYGIKSVI